jgi:hypothetical protein
MVCDDRLVSTMSLCCHTMSRSAEKRAPGLDGGRGTHVRRPGQHSAFARETLGRTAISSIIRPANVASIHVAQSFGAIAG